MPRRHAPRFGLALAAVDALICGGAFLIAMGVCRADLLSEAMNAGSTLASDVALAAALATLVTPVILTYMGGTESQRAMPLPQLIRRIASAATLGALGLMAGAWAFELETINLPVLLMHTGVSFAAVFLFWGVLRYWPRTRPIGEDQHRWVMVIGTGPRARRLADRIVAHPDWGLRIRGFLDDDPPREYVRELGKAYLGRLERLADLLAHEVVDEVIIALPRSALASEAVADAVALCEVIGVDVTVANDLFETRLAQPRFDHLLGLPVMTLSTRHHHSVWKLAVKRSLDIGVAGLGILVLLPFGLLLALAIKLDSPGPAFFVQRRCGVRGRPFPFLKFRTMYVDSEERLDEIRALNEQSGPIFKAQNDPRITRVGRFLRKYSIDELPQLINVVLGQMSLVGPRPPLPIEVKRYEIDHRGRLSMRPGITCLWQVSGRNEISFEDWVKLDLEYVKRWSLTLDLEILLATVPAVFSGRGAS